MMPHVFHQFLHVGEGAAAAERGAEHHLSYREDTQRGVTGHYAGGEPAQSDHAEVLTTMPRRTQVIRRVLNQEMDLL